LVFFAAVAVIVLLWMMVADVLTFRWREGAVVMRLEVVKIKQTFVAFAGWGKAAIGRGRGDGSRPADRSEQAGKGRSDRRRKHRPEDIEDEYFADTTDSRDAQRT
jgi:hypothetical protein